MRAATTGPCCHAGRDQGSSAGNFGMQDASRKYQIEVRQSGFGRMASPSTMCCLHHRQNLTLVILWGIQLENWW